MAGKSVQLYVQAAIKSALTSQVTSGGATVPVVDNPYDGQAGPYIVCNNITETWDDDINSTQRWLTATIDVYTTDYKTAGTVTNKDIRRQVCNTLADGTLSITGCSFRGCLLDQNLPDFVEPDGETVHGQVRFRIHVDTLT